jgi:hypothetical protein
MAAKNATPTPARARADQSERRSGADRRRVDKGPPGGRERRRLVEPRRPEVEELEMSESEWAQLSAELPSPPAPAVKKSS